MEELRSDPPSCHLEVLNSASLSSHPFLPPSPTFPSQAKMSTRPQDPHDSAATTASPYLENPITSVGDKAKIQVDREVYQAKKSMEAMLNRIVQCATKNGDNKEVLKTWKEEWMTLFRGSSRSADALDHFRCHGRLDEVEETVREPQKRVRPSFDRACFRFFPFARWEARG